VGGGGQWAAVRQGRHLGRGWSTDGVEGVAGVGERGGAAAPPQGRAFGLRVVLFVLGSIRESFGSYIFILA
jgi:hypothetical protein